MFLAHRIALSPNRKQATHLSRAAGVARFAYNWALAEWERQYKLWTFDNSLPRPNGMALKRQLNSIKREQFPWMLEVTKSAPQGAIDNLDEAYRSYFAKRSKRPKFRKKGVKDRFYLSNDRFRVIGKRIRVPRLGWVRMREALRFDGKIMSATISRVADDWFVSITVDVQTYESEEEGNHCSVGVDLGVSSLATLSTGEKIVGPKPHKALTARLRRLNRSLARKKSGSTNRRKAKFALSKLHARIANIRKDSLHKLTTRIARDFSVVGIENLNVSGMLKNKHLSRAVADMGFYEFRQQLGYKMKMVGGVLVLADRFYPSSKTCSCCGSVMEKLSLSTRLFTCEDCGHTMDRDLNAAINLRNLAVSSTVSACGEEGSGLGSATETKPASMKQEVSVGARRMSLTERYRKEPVSA